MIKLISMQQDVSYYGMALAASDTGLLAIAYSKTGLNYGVDIYKCTKYTCILMNKITIEGVSRTPYHLHLALSSDGRYLYCGTSSKDSKLILFNLNTDGEVINKQDLSNIKGFINDTPITAIAITPNMSQIAFGFNMEKVGIYNINENGLLTDKGVVLYERHRNDFFGASLAFIDNETLLVGNPSLSFEREPAYLYRYTKINGRFELTGTLEDSSPEHDMFGVSLTRCGINGQYVLGMADVSKETGPHVYAKEDTLLKTLNLPTAQGTVKDSCYGISLACGLSSNPFLAIGDMCRLGENGESGSVYVLTEGFS